MMSWSSITDNMNEFLIFKNIFDSGEMCKMFHENVFSTLVTTAVLMRVIDSLEFKSTRVARSMNIFM